MLGSRTRICIRPGVRAPEGRGFIKDKSGI
jgi:hypothetical protein